MLNVIIKSFIVGIFVCFCFI